jgi:surface polysaccharide O-acyltransferase-like enzyme
MTEPASFNLRHRAIHFDLIRVIATYFVVQLHVATPWLWRESDYNGEIFLTSLFFDVFGRIGVPLFLMISGALLLNHQEPYQPFFKKRFSRVFIPLIFWTIVYEFKIGAEYLHFHPGASFSEIWQQLKDPFSGPVYDHLWFLYMIAGMYLVTPLLRKMVGYLNRFDQAYLLLLWVLFNCVLPLIYHYSDFRLGIWMPVLTPYLAYYLMGYFLMKNDFGRKQIPLIWIVFALTYLCTVFLVWLDTSRQGSIQTFFLGHHSVTIFIQCTCAFILLNHYGIRMSEKHNEKRYNRFKLLGRMTFGIYLVHPLIIELFEGGLLGGIIVMATTVMGSDIPPVLGIPLTAILVTLVSILIIWVMLKTPVLKKLV